MACMFSQCLHVPTSYYSLLGTYCYGPTYGSYLRSYLWGPNFWCFSTPPSHALLTEVSLVRLHLRLRWNHGSGCIYVSDSCDSR